MALDEAFLKSVREKSGIKEVSPDHWIYSEGSSTTFVASPPDADDAAPDAQEAPSTVAHGSRSPSLNRTAARLQVALNEAQSDEQSVSGDDVPGLVELDDDEEEVEWVASTYTNSQLINLFVCRASGEADTVLAALHGDRGFIEEVDGPWASLEAAKASFGKVPEGWSDL